MVVETGEIPEIKNGRANAFDFATEDGFWSSGNENVNPNETFAWTELNPYSAFIYAFGDLNCHNKGERSILINENQMPVCTRDVGIFLVLQLAVFGSLEKVTIGGQLKIHVYHFYLISG